MPTAEKIAVDSIPSFKPEPERVKVKSLRVRVTKKASREGIESTQSSRKSRNRRQPFILHRLINNTPARHLQLDPRRGMPRFQRNTLQKTPSPGSSLVHEQGLPNQTSNFADHRPRHKLQIKRRKPDPHRDR